MFRPSGKSIYSKSHLEAPSTYRGVFIYNVLFTTVQRKEYSETLNRESDAHFRVEVNQREPTPTGVFSSAHPLPPLCCAPPPQQHLLTCELDGREMKTVENCVSKLKRLDGKGRVWPQQMIMEAHRGYLVLSDIETKVRLRTPQIRAHVWTQTQW